MASDVTSLASVSLYVYICLFLYTLVSNKYRISLILVFYFGVCYMFIPEILFDKTIPSISENYIIPIKYIFIFLVTTTLGYNLKTHIKVTPKFKNINMAVNNRYIYINHKIGFSVILIFLILYIILIFPIASKSFMVGKSSESLFSSNPIIAFIQRGLPYVLPPFFAFYFKNIVSSKKAFLKSFLFSLPIFLLLIGLGGRHYLLFSFLSYFFILKGFKIDKITLIAFVLFITISSIIKQYRHSGFEGYIRGEQTYSDIKATSSPNNITEKIASYGANEGIVNGFVNMYAYVNDKGNGFSYGTESLSFLYFWIPRSVWEDKPTQIGYWLLRTYRSDAAEGHSIDFGYFGIFYMDFGFYITLFICFLLGLLMKRLDGLLMKTQLEKNNIFNVLLVFSFPAIFYFMRSPLPAFIEFIGVYLLYKSIKSIFKIKRI